MNIENTPAVSTGNRPKEAVPTVGPDGKRRIAEIDYLKSIYIILMVIFHLVYIGDKYPYFKQIVYTFHMPAFLILSGYLVNVRKTPAAFARSVLWLFIPYAIMESGYAFMASVLPIRESIDRFTWSVLLEKVFVRPLGPYWYLHTLIIAHILCYTVHRIPFRDKLSQLIVLTACFGILAECRIVSMTHALYFIIGFAISLFQQDLLSVFRPSCLSLAALTILCLNPNHLESHSLWGVVITYLSFSFLLWVYPYISHGIRQPLQFIGKNTLSILLFSPIFTLLSKPLTPLFSFDPTGLIFTCAAVSLTLCGSFAIAWTSDRLKLSRFFCGKPNLLIRNRQQTDLSAAPK